MKVIVVDASVIIKWYLPEDDMPQAALIQNQLEVDELIAYAPNLLISEIANILWKRRRQITESDALDTLQDALSSGIEFEDPDGLILAAYQIARKYERSVYDSLYEALAREKDCDFITADERLFNAISKQEPRVKLLREYVVE